MSPVDTIPLPDVLAQIEEVAGRDAALAVMEAKGGTTVYLPAPKSLADDHWLVELVGREKAERICALFVTHRPYDGSRSETGFLDRKGAGATIEIPMGQSLQRARRDATIRERTRAGASAGAIARDLGMSTRGVQRIRQRLRERDEL